MNTHTQEQEQPDILTLYTQLTTKVQERVAQAKATSAEWHEKSIDAKAEVQKLEAEYAAIQSQIEDAAKSVVETGNTELFNQLKARRRDLPMLISAAKIRLSEIEVVIEDSIYTPYQELLKEVRKDNEIIYNLEKVVDKARSNKNNTVESVSTMLRWHLDRKRAAQNKLVTERQNLASME